MPSHSSDSYQFINLDAKELIATTTYVLGAAREVDTKAAAALH